MFVINYCLIIHLIAHFYYLPLFNYPQQLLNGRVICLKVTKKKAKWGCELMERNVFGLRVPPHYLFFLDPQGLAVLTAFI